jgi:hypothetical protein
MRPSAPNKGLAAFSFAMAVAIASSFSRSTRRSRALCPAPSCEGGCSLGHRLCALDGGDIATAAAAVLPPRVPSLALLRVTGSLMEKCDNASVEGPPSEVVNEPAPARAPPLVVAVHSKL